MGRDSNSRVGCPTTRFPGVRLKPLGHPSRSFVNYPATPTSGSVAASRLTVVPSLRRGEPRLGYYRRRGMAPMLPSSPRVKEMAHSGRQIGSDLRVPLDGVRHRRGIRGRRDRAATGAGAGLGAHRSVRPVLPGHPGERLVRWRGPGYRHDGAVSDDRLVFLPRPLPFMGDRQCERAHWPGGVRGRRRRDQRPE